MSITNISYIGCTVYSTSNTGIIDIFQIAYRYNLFLQREIPIIFVIATYIIGYIDCSKAKTDYIGFPCSIADYTDYLKVENRLYRLFEKKHNRLYR